MLWSRTSQGVEVSACGSKGPVLLLVSRVTARTCDVTAHLKFHFQQLTTPFLKKLLNRCCLLLLRFVRTLVLLGKAGNAHLLIRTAA